MAFVIGHPKNLIRLWAGIHSDFESLLLLFLTQDKGWTFSDFAKCCKQQQITLIMHCTIGSGKSRDFHYKAVCNMIFSCAKSVWLNTIPRSENYESDVEPKRRLGGFYLLYLLYRKQPWKNYCKISMDIEDLEKAMIWLRTTRLESYNSEIRFILSYLISQKCFHFSISALNFGVTSLERRYLEASISKFTTISLRQEMRNIQDELNWAPLVNNVQQKVVDYYKMKCTLYNRLQQQEVFDIPGNWDDVKPGTREEKNRCYEGYGLRIGPEENCMEIAWDNVKNSAEGIGTDFESGAITGEEILSTDKMKVEVDDVKPEPDDVKPEPDDVKPEPDCNNDKKYKSATENLNPVKKTLTSQKGSTQMVSIVKKLKDLADKPIITVADLTGNIMEEREMIRDATLRLIRGTKRKRNFDSMGRYIAQNPYLSESGIFGRHLGFSYDEERKYDSEKRASNIKSENLWNYITEDSFI